MFTIHFKLFRQIFLYGLVALALLLAGCASSPMYEEVQSQIAQRGGDASQATSVQQADAVDGSAQYIAQAAITTQQDSLDNQADTLSNEKSIPLLVVKHDYHTAVLLPRDAAARIHPDILTDYAKSGRSYEYWEFGWGDEKFFTAPINDAYLAIRSMVVPTSSLVSVIGLNRAPEKYFKILSYTKVMISPQDYDNLLTFIRQSLQTDANGNLIKSIESEQPDRMFYKGRGEYALFNNCNHWTADALATAGIPLDRSTLTAGAIFKQIGGIQFTK